MKISGKLKFKKINLLIKEAEDASAKKGKPYKFQWKGTGYHLKLISDQDDSGKTFYFPMALRNQGEGVSGEDSEYLVGNDGVKYDYAFNQADTEQWVKENFDKNGILIEKNFVESEELYGKEGVVKIFSSEGASVTKKDPRFKKLEPDLPTEGQPGAEPKPSIPAPEKRSSRKLDINDSKSIAKNIDSFSRFIMERLKQKI
jgi:hypothetical protein